MILSPDEVIVNDIASRTLVRRETSPKSADQDRP